MLLKSGKESPGLQNREERDQEKLADIQIIIRKVSLISGIPKPLKRRDDI